MKSPPAIWSHFELNSPRGLADEAPVLAMSVTSSSILPADPVERNALFDFCCW